MKSSPITIYQVHAFAKGSHGGSPTGVVLDAGALTDAQCQYIARQLQVSHTAFVGKAAADDQVVPVRFFTKEGELKSCGHGAIAAHFVQAQVTGLRESRSFIQQVKAGPQAVDVMVNGSNISVFLHQSPVSYHAVEMPTLVKLMQALGIGQADLAPSLPVVMASPGASRFLVGIRSVAGLHHLSPDMKTLSSLCEEHHSIGCFVYCTDELWPTATATARMFAPLIGVPEDIINGNSSACLGDYLLRLNGHREMTLLVTQGQLFNQEGLVQVKARKTGSGYETVIGGTAVLHDTLHLQLPEQL